jgi:hypothetical protein
MRSCLSIQLNLVSWIAVLKFSISKLQVWLVGSSRAINDTSPPWVMFSLSIGYLPGNDSGQMVT